MKQQKFLTPCYTHFINSKHPQFLTSPHKDLNLSSDRTLEDHCWEVADTDQEYIHWATRGLRRCFAGAQRNSGVAADNSGNVIDTAIAGSDHDIGSASQESPAGVYHSLKHSAEEKSTGLEVHRSPAVVVDRMVMVLHADYRHMVSHLAGVLQNVGCFVEVLRTVGC